MSICVQSHAFVSGALKGHNWGHLYQSLRVDAPMPLTDTACKKAACPEGRSSIRLADEKSLYLEVTSAGGKYWRWKYRFGGKEKRLAFGVYPEVSLAQARVLRDEA